MQALYTRTTLPFDTCAETEYNTGTGTGTNRFTAPVAGLSFVLREVRAMSSDVRPKNVVRKESAPRRTTSTPIRLKMGDGNCGGDR